MTSIMEPNIIDVLPNEKDNNPNNLLCFTTERFTYYPGQTLNGIIHINNGQTLTFIDLIVKFTLSQSWMFEDKEQTHSEIVNTVIKECPLELDKKTNGGSQANILKPGKFKYKFSLDIPNNIEPSFEYPIKGQTASHRYSLVVLLDSQVMPVKAERVIHILKKNKQVNPNDLFQSSNKAIKKFALMNKGSSSLTVSSEFGVFKLGSRIPLKIDVNNSDCKMLTEYVKVDLIREVKFYGKDKKLRHSITKKIHSENLEHKITQSKLITYSVLLKDEDPTGLNLRDVDVLYPKVREWNMIMPSTEGSLVRCEYVIKATLYFESFVNYNDRPRVLYPVIAAHQTQQDLQKFEELERNEKLKQEQERIYKQETQQKTLYNNSMLPGQYDLGVGGYQQQQQYAQQNEQKYYDPSMDNKEGLGKSLYPDLDDMSNDGFGGNNNYMQNYGNNNNWGNNNNNFGGNYNNNWGNNNNNFGGSQFGGNNNNNFGGNQFGGNNNNNFGGNQFGGNNNNNFKGSQFGGNNNNFGTNQFGGNFGGSQFGGNNNNNFGGSQFGNNNNNQFGGNNNNQFGNNNNNQFGGSQFGNNNNNFKASQFGGNNSNFGNNNNNNFGGNQFGGNNNNQFGGNNNNQFGGSQFGNNNNNNFGGSQFGGNNNNNSFKGSQFGGNVNPFDQEANSDDIDDPFKTSESRNKYDIEDPFKTEYLYKNHPPQTQQNSQQQKQQSNQFINDPQFPQSSNQNDSFPQNPSKVPGAKPQSSNPNIFDDINNPFGDASFPTSSTNQNSNPFENNNNNNFPQF